MNYYSIGGTIGGGVEVGIARVIECIKMDIVTFINLIFHHSLRAYLMIKYANLYFLKVKMMIFAIYFVMPSKPS